MDIKDAQEEKEKAERLIMDIIIDLVEKTGVTFNDVSITVHTFPFGKPVLSSLKINLTL